MDDNVYLGIDLGTKSIGLAKSKGIISSAFKTIRFLENDFNAGVTELIKVINENNVKTLVFGYPKNMDGSIGHRVEMVENFIELLQQKIEIEIHKVDERLTTKMANSIMLEADLSRKKRKKNKDALAAQIILDTFLQQKNK